MAGLVKFSPILALARQSMAALGMRHANDALIAAALVDAERLVLLHHPTDLTGRFRRVELAVAIQVRHKVIGRIGPKVSAILVGACIKRRTERLTR